VYVNHRFAQKNRIRLPMNRWLWFLKR